MPGREQIGTLDVAISAEYHATIIRIERHIWPGQGSTQTCVQIVVFDNQGVIQLIKFHTGNSLAVVAMATLTAVSSVGAETVSFNDAFSGSIIPASRYISGDSSVTVEPDHLLLTGVSSDSSKQRARLRLNGVTDNIEVSVGLSAVSEPEPRSVVRLVARLYNDTQDGGFDGNIGDVVSIVQLTPNTDGTSVSSAFCLYREIGDDWAGIPVFDGEACVLVSGESQYETKYTASMSIDRAQKTLEYTINGSSITIDLPTEVYHSASNSHYIEAVSRGSVIAGRVYTAKNDQFELSLANLPDDPFIYSLWDSGKPGATVSVTNGELRLAATSASADRVRSRVAIDGATDSLQVDARMSGESNIPDGATGRARVASSLYNTVADGGTDDALGDVFATTQMLLRDDTLIIEACAWEATSPDWVTAEALYTSAADGECEVLVSDAALDTNYLLALSLDRVNRKIVHRVNNQVFEHDISTAIFDGSSANDMAMRTDVRGAPGNVVAYFDNLIAGNAVSGVDNSVDNDTAVCVDTVPLGDGWGWNGSSSCTIAPVTQAVVCVDSPPIGDGWGWDGSSSCQIAVSEDISNDEPLAVCYDTTPVGDGWGWNGSTSCIVTSSEPVCFDSEPKGDGWGWDGNTSCRVGSTACVDTPPAGDGWGWDGVRSCRL